MDTQNNPSIGVVTKVVGNVTVKSAGNEHGLKAGDVVHLNDKIITDDNASVALIMTDGKIIEQGPDSSQKLENINGFVPVEQIQNALSQNVTPEQISDAIIHHESIVDILPVHVDHLFYVPWVTLGKVESGFPTSHQPWIPPQHEDFIGRVIQEQQPFTPPPVDQANGTLGESSIIVFEEAEPNQYLGDFTKSSVSIPITFTPADNEVLISITINNIPDGAVVTAGAQTVIGNGSNSITIPFSDLGSLNYQQPQNESDGDYNLNYTALIQDPDSGATNVLNGVIQVIVDAVADKPTDVSGVITNEETENSLSGLAYSVAGQQHGNDSGTYLYEINLSNGNIVQSFQMSDTHFNVEALDLNSHDGFLYGLATTGNPSDQGLIKIDPSNGNTTVIGGDIPTANLAGFTFDEFGNLYGATIDANKSDFYTVNLTTGDITLIGQINAKLGDLSFDPINNELFGVGKSGNDNLLYQIDPTNGNILNTITITNVSNSTDLESLRFDSSGNLWSIDRISGDIYTINPDTGVATFHSTTLGASDLADNGFESLAIIPGGSEQCIDSGNNAQFTLNATFKDFGDGTENNFILLSIPAGWSAPSGTVITVHSGDFNGMVAPGTYLEINAASFIDGSGNATITGVTLTTPSGITSDTPFSLSVYAVTEETNFSGIEPYLFNNIAATPGQNINVVVCPPENDLSITKTDGSLTYTPGTEDTYTITAHNAGPDNITDGVITDTISTAFIINQITTTPFTSLVDNGNGTQTITWTDQIINSSGDATVYLNGIYSSSATGDQIDKATVSSISANDPNLFNNIATDKDTSNLQANLVITKVDTLDSGNTDPSLTAGSQVSYVITVTNNGPSDAYNVSVADTFPGVNLTNISSTDSNFNPNTNSWNVDTLASGATTTLHITGIIPSSDDNSTFANTATATSSDANTVQITDTDNLNQNANLVITKVDTLDSGNTDPSLTAGSQVSYVITVTNNGPSDAYNVSVADTFPGVNLTNISSTDSNFNPNTNSWNVDTLASGATTTLHITGIIPSSDADSTFANTATATSSDANTVQITDTDNLNQNANLVITKVDTLDSGNTDPSLTAGNQVTYDITVTNNGPSDAYNVSVADTFPGVNLTNISSTDSNFNPNTNSWNVDTLASGATTTLHITGIIPSSDDNSTFANTATATSSDANTVQITDTDNLNQNANLVITKVDTLDSGNTDPSLTAGSQVSYVITVTNNGPSDAYNVSVADTFPGVNLTNISSTDSNFNPNTNSWNVDTLASGATTTLHITGIIPSSDADSTFANTATATSSDANTVQITDTDNLNQNANLVITKVDTLDSGNTDPSLTAGSQVSYVITVTNNGPSDAYNVSVADTFPGVNLTNISSTDSNFNPNTNSWNVDTLASGATTTLHITGTIPSSDADSTFANTATATSSDANTVQITDTDNLNQNANLVITKVDTLDSGNTDPSLTAGSQVSYVITVTNNGPSDAYNVSVADTFPGVNLTNISSTDSNFNPNTNSWNVDTLASGATTTLHITGIIPSSDDNSTFANTATATSSDASQVSATDTDVLTQQYDLSILKTVADFSSSMTQDIVTYTITIHNAGPSIASNFSMTDAFLPADLLSGSIASLSLVSETQGAFNTTNGTWSGLTLDANGNATLVFKATINTNPSAQPLNSHDILGDINNTATITNAPNDTNSANNSSSADVFHEAVWMPDTANTTSSDPVQNQLLGNFSNGYGLNIESNITSSVDSQIASGALTVKVLALPTEGTVGYFDGIHFNPISVGQTLSSTIFNELTYKPAADGSTSDTDFGQFKYGLYDSNNDQTALGIVDLNTVMPVHPISQEIDIHADNKSPLTPGNDQDSPPASIDTSIFNQVTDFTNSQIQLFTDFSANNDNVYKQTGELDDSLESIIGHDPGLLAQIGGQVTVDLQITIGAGVYTFAIVDPSISLNNTGWTLDEATGTVSKNNIDLLTNTISFDHITTTINNQTVTLAQFLNDPSHQVQQNWVLVYHDNNNAAPLPYSGIEVGNNNSDYQAREFTSTTTFNSQAEPNVIINGNLNLPNILYGSTGNDKITGGYGNDLIEGRQGSDTLTGNGGNDTFLFQGLSINGGDINTLHLDTTTITDFTNANPSLNSNGDVLEFNQLFTDLANFGTGNAITDVSVLDKYISINGTGSGSSAQTTINISSSANSNVVHTFHIEGVNLGTGDTAINNMVNITHTLQVHA